MGDILWVCLGCFADEDGGDWGRCRLFVSDGPVCPRCAAIGQPLIHHATNRPIPAEHCPPELVDVLERQDDPR